MQCGFVIFTEAQSTVQVDECRDAKVLRAMDPDFTAGERVHHAEELLQVQNALAEITGEFGSDDLLGRIFSSFCIGK